MSSASARKAAIGGIKAEENVVRKFNEWKTDKDAQRWLTLMNYDLNNIESVVAERIGEKSEKADVVVNIEIKIVKKKASKLESVENIQVKKFSGKGGSNQMERKHVKKYVEIWHISPQVEELLNLFTGTTPPRPGSRNPKRMYIDEFTESEKKILKDFFEKNMVMIISDVVRGRGRYAVEWILIIQDYNDNAGKHIYNDVLLSINEAINYYVGDHQVIITEKGGLKIGNVTIQRKGGDNGGEGACNLQFKSNPGELLAYGLKYYTGKSIA